MRLNISKGNMYDFITHTGNTVKGRCLHDCSYCYMKHWGILKPVRFDEKELKIGMGIKKGMEINKFIFVGSSCDMFSENIEPNWIERTLDHCKEYPENKYFFQSKNVARLLRYKECFPLRTSLCTTIETNRFYTAIMRLSPETDHRAYNMSFLENFEKYVTIEPILDFDLKEMIPLIKQCNPNQVNIGADSGGHKLPEPPSGKIHELIFELEKFTKVELKKNLNRLIK